MPRFNNVWTQDGAIGQCADCGMLVYRYQDMWHHKCRRGKPLTPTDDTNVDYPKPTQEQEEGNGKT